MKYVLTGASGKLGTFVLKYLKEHGAEQETIAVIRNEKHGSAIKELGFEVRIADYTDENSLVKAFRGGERLLFISSLPGGETPRIKQHENAVTAAKKAGIGFIAYTGLAKADQSMSILAPDHAATERMIIESGIDHSFLRNNWYLENELPVFERTNLTGVFAYSAGNGRVGWALRREYAEVCTNILLGIDKSTGALEISGQAISYSDIAASYAKISEKPFEEKSFDDEAYKEFLQNANVPEKAIGGTIAIQKDIREGALDIDHSDFERVLGRPLTPLQDAIKEILKGNA
ncbi:NAD(P)H-binding protein [Lachnospiraceae bacterium 54-53]